MCKAACKRIELSLRLLGGAQATSEPEAAAHRAHHARSSNSVAQALQRERVKPRGAGRGADPRHPHLEGHGTQEGGSSGGPLKVALIKGYIA